MSAVRLSPLAPRQASSDLSGVGAPLEGAEPIDRGDHPHTTRRDRQREETRRRVFEAALAVFRQDGVAECRIDDIAALAGVSRGTFYFHFPTKDDVLVELMRLGGEAVANTVATLPDEAALQTVFEALAQALSDQWQGDARILPDLATVALKQTSAQLGDPESNPLRAELAHRFRLGVERGELNDFLPAEVLSDLYLANVLAGLLAWCAYPSFTLVQVLDGVTSLFLLGAGHRAPSDV